MSLVLIPLCLSFFIAYLLTPITIRFFTSRSWLEDPKLRQQKTGNATALYSVPRGGGIPIFSAIFITSLLFLPLDLHLIAIFISAFIALIVGVVDDIKDISPITRLFVNILTGLIIILFGIGINYISNPLGTPGSVIFLNKFTLNFTFFKPVSISLISALLTIFWIVWCTNVVGWSAGVEGQLPGFVSISAIFIGIIGLRFSSDTTQWPVIILAASVAGAYLGFLPYNFFPQKIMPGYSGKSLAGFFLAVLSILSGAKLATLIFLLGIPMIDAFFVIVRRLKNKKPIYLADGQHLHHLLLKAGFSRPQISILYWLFSLILGLISLFLNSRQKLYFIIGLFFLFFAFILQLSRRTQPKSSR